MTNMQTSKNKSETNNLIMQTKLCEKNYARGGCNLSFPAVRGIQAGKEYYVSMCSLRMVAKLFIFNEEEIPPNLRAQRTLNKARIPEISSYITNNPKDYVLSALTASIDGDIEFEPIDSEPAHFNIGRLSISSSSRILINDGQHRRAAIQAALRDLPELGDETIPVVFFLDLGLSRSQQMFADLNRYALRPTMSLNVLYDHRDDNSRLALEVMQNVWIFADLTETERTSLSNRSTNLFTLSGIYHATKDLLSRKSDLSYNEKLRIASEYWSEVAYYMEEWKLAKEGIISGQELRCDYICGHTIALIALGRAGSALLDAYPIDWKKQLKKLNSINWSRNNKQCWEGRVMTGGKISNSRNNVVLMSNIIKIALNIPLSIEEQNAEYALQNNKTDVEAKII